MKVLITGSSGRIGAAVAQLLGQSHEVVGLDIVAGTHTTRVGSICDKALVNELVSTVDAVVHTAALHAPHVGIAAKSAFVETNVTGTKHLLEAALRHDVRKFVYTSTTSVYGAALEATDHAVWVTEELRPIARDIYDETKLAAEQLCCEASKSGLSCVSLRMSRCFPEPEELMAIYRMYRGVDARDVAGAHELALIADIRGFEIFNISAATLFQRDECGELFTSAEAVVQRHYPWAAAAFSRRGWKLPGRIDRVYVTRKAQELLGYAPMHNIESLFDASESSAG